MPTVAEMIEAILSHGKTLEEIATAADVTVQAVYSWQSGRVRRPRRDALRRIEDLHRSVVGGAPVPPPPAEAADPASAEAEGPAFPTAATRPIRADSVEMPDAAPPPERHATPPPRAAGEAFRFIHCADLHVDSPLKGLRRVDPRHASWIQMATRRAFTRLVDMAIADEVAFVVIAGDLFDGEWKSADTGIYISRQLARLTTAGIHVFAIAGNHDAASVVSRSVRWPEAARRFGDTAESIELPDLGIVIHGRSFGDRYVSSDFVEGYPPARPGLFNLGILHTSLAGDSGHATYAPCTPRELAGRGYDYWALGHVHVPRVVQTDPHIVYSGNIQGRDIGETGPRGCQVVTVDSARRPSVHFVPLDDVRWERIQVPVDGHDAQTVDDVVATVIDVLESRLPDDDRLLACRVVLTGATPLHRRLFSRRGSLRDEVAAVIDSQVDGRICIEQVVVQTTDPDAAPPADGAMPPRAVALLDEEFQRLRTLGVDSLLAEDPELRKLFNELRVLDSIQSGRRDSIQAADRWATFIAEASEVLNAEIGEATDDGEDDQ